MLEINKQLININYSKGRTITPKYIVVHETDNESVNANAMANRNYFATHEEAQASTHFLVDDSNIIQACEITSRCWHVGDNNGYSDITNSNSVGIEICVNADGNYEQAKSNTIELVRYLMSELGLGIDRVKMHNNASGKHCPRRILDSGLWNEFLERVNGSEVVTVTNTQSTYVEQSPIQKAKEFVGSRCLELQQKLIAKGYDCGGYGADSDFGQGTYNSLIQYQKENNLECDGLAGTLTFAKLNEVAEYIEQSPTQIQGSDKVLSLQRICNQILGSGLVEDGLWGNLTDLAVQNLPLCGVDYTQPILTKWIQSILGISCDGIFWHEADSYLKQYQNTHGLKNDGICGYYSFKSLALS